MLQPYKMQQASLSQRAFGCRHCGTPVRAALSRRPKLTRAASEAGKEAQTEEQKNEPKTNPPPAVALPKTGYFALADTNKEVYSKAGEKFDPTKRGGRYKPEFIWNQDWQKALQMQESLQRGRDEAVARGATPEASSRTTGAVSFSRLRDLNSMDVDLSEALRPKPKPQASTNTASTSSKPVVVRTVPLPRNDAKKLERLGRIQGLGQVVIATSSKPEDLEEQARLQAESQAAYEADKAGQRLWTAALSLVGVVATASTYGREAGISYAVGALGGLVYLRLLGRTVDGMGGEGAGLSSAAAQPRLLIPIILALGYNRWNTMYAEDAGVTLNLLPMLVGFLTYKVAIISRQAKQVMDDITASGRKDKQ
uniref:CGL160/ATPI domain-containing protein n=1 Tax=Chlamydomonas leiostraca TaxID=1034604 RepID=A0A7S0RYR5_9CHLO